MNVFVVNTKMLTPDKYPKTWIDLTDARFKKNICSARADKSGSSYMQLCNVIAIYGDKGWDIYKGIMKNTVISASSGAVPKFVNDGEQAVGITLEDNAFRYFAGGGPVAIVYPTDGTVAAQMALPCSREHQTSRMPRNLSIGVFPSQSKSILSMRWLDALFGSIARIPKACLRFRLSRQYPMILHGQQRIRKPSSQKFMDIAMELGL